MTTSVFCLALALFGANGWAGSIDSVAPELLRRMGHRATQAKPGDWISYRTDGGGGRVSFWRLSAVGAEKDALGRDALWIEIELGQHRDLRAPLLQMKMLVARAEGLAGKGVTRLFVAIGADPPQEVPPHRLHELWRSPFSAPHPRTALAGDDITRVVDSAWAPAKGSAEYFAAGGLPSDEIIRVGEETRLMTHAGTLPVIPIEIYQRGALIERIWMSHRLPLLGLAKLEMPAIGHTMEVTGFGTDATPRMISPQQVEPTIRLDAAGRANATAGPEVAEGAQ